MSKGFALMLILILTVSCLIMMKPAFTQSTPTPSVPEFTLKFEEHPYDIPPVYGIDQFTGANITIQQEQHVLNQTITVTIRNQPFIASYNGENYYLYYNIRAKGHFGNNWNEFYPIDPYHSFSANTYSTNLPNGLLSPSNSNHTVTAIPNSYPSGSQVDFQVESIVWRGFQYFVPDTNLFSNATGHYEQRFAFYGISGWSNTQTVAIPANTSPSSTPVMPEFPLTILIISFLITATLIGTVLIKRKQVL